MTDRNNLIVQMVKEIIFETLDENISDYCIDDLILECLMEMDNSDEIDVKEIVLKALESWDVDRVT